LQLRGFASGTAKSHFTMHARLVNIVGAGAVAGDLQRLWLRESRRFYPKKTLKNDVQL
jgi:hypothetical protein